MCWRVAVLSGSSGLPMTHSRSFSYVVMVRSPWRPGLGQAAGEHLHFLHRLLVAFSLGHRDSFPPCVESLVLASIGGQRLPEQLPCRRIVRIERDCALQMLDGRCRVSSL